MTDKIQNTQILEGRSLAQDLIDSLNIEVGRLKYRSIHPHLAVLLVGDNPDNKLFVSLKKKKAQEIGIDFSCYIFDQKDTEEDIIQTIQILNEDEEVHGVMVQLPMPKKFNQSKILSKISQEKDVDNLNGSNFISPTVSAITQIIDNYKLPQDKILIIGRGILVGQPLVEYFKKKNIKYTLWEKGDYKPNQLTKFDLIISCSGQKNLISINLDLSNTYLIDGSGKDICFDEMYDCCAGLTPPIGGVGPLTIANLLKNTVEATKAQQK